MTKEIWKNIIVDGKVHDWYSISNHGRIMSHIQQVRATRGFSNVINPNYKNILSCFYKKNTTYGYIQECRIGLKFPIGFFDDYEFASNSNSKNSIKRNFSIHGLVMSAFKPIDEFPPIPKEDWDMCPESAKQFIRDTVYINHIDHNPENNLVENLEYVTPKENSRKAVEFHDGNVANKMKKVIVETKVKNPLEKLLGV